MTTEALRTQLDTLRLEKQQLEVENARLRESNPNAAAVADVETDATRWREEATQLQADREQLGHELSQLRAVYEQLVGETEEEQARAAQKDDEVAEKQRADEAAIAELQQELDRCTTLLREREANCERCEAEVVRARDSAELQCLRAVAAELPN